MGMLRMFALRDWNYVVMEERYAPAPRLLRFSRWRSDHEKARHTWDYRWGRDIDCGTRLASMVAKERGAIA
jgi:hypothetical protein